MGFIFEMAFTRLCTQVIGNQISGRPLFSGFFSNPEPEYKTTTEIIPTTNDHKLQFIYWSLGDIPGLDKIDFSNQTHGNESEGNIQWVRLWNKRRGNLMVLSTKDSLERNVVKCWKLWEKLEN